MNTLNHDNFEAEALLANLDYLHFIEEQGGPGSFGQALAFARAATDVTLHGFAHLLSDYARNFKVSLIKG